MVHVLGAPSGVLALLVFSHWEMEGLAHNEVVEHNNALVVFSPRPKLFITTQAKKNVVKRSIIEIKAGCIS